MKRNRKKSQKNYSKRPIKIDTTSLFNHLKLIQRSSLPSVENDFIITQLTMHNYQYLSHGELQDIYILVGWTKYAVSCQMVVLDKDVNCTIDSPVVVPDLVRCTPISVWTTIISPNRSKDENIEDCEYLTCEPRIMIDDSDYLKGNGSAVIQDMKLAVILGTNCGRVLSVQLSIQVKEEQLDDSYSLGRHVLLKSNNNIFEPLLLKTKSRNGTLKDKSNQMNHNSDFNISWSKVCGGVSSISHLYKYNGPLSRSISVSLTQNAKHFRSEMFVWIVWEDGTFIRFPRLAFFLGERPSTDEEETFLTQFIFKGRVESLNGHTAVSPLPKSFPSFLSLSCDKIDIEDDEEEDDYTPMPKEILFHTQQLGIQENSRESYEAFTYQPDTLSSNANPDSSIPTISFYTTEEHLKKSDSNDFMERNIIAQTISSIEPGWKFLKDTKTAISSTLMGVISGRNRRSHSESHFQSSSATALNDSEPKNQDNLADRDDISLLPALQQPPKMLHFSTFIYDGQRRIITSTIDPLEGRRMACSDNLGRVFLVDLESKQIVRVWKGFRDAICSWVQCPYAIDGVVHRVKYLVIHSRQRRVVEIYRMDHGPIVAKIDVKHNSLSVIQCAVQIGGGDMVGTFYECSF